MKEAAVVILSVFAGLILIASLGFTAGISKVRKEMMHEMQNDREKGGSRHEFRRGTGGTKGRKEM
jgi:F0F1-type ATP synthase assembly protein I